MFDCQDLLLNLQKGFCGVSHVGLKKRRLRKVQKPFLVYIIGIQRIGRELPYGYVEEAGGIVNQYNVSLSKGNLL